MVQAKLLDQIKADVLSAYGSFENPHFGFVEASVKSQPYRLLVTDLKEVFVLTEQTELNNDVSFVYYLQCHDTTLTLYLSMVGRYAFVRRIVGGHFDACITSDKQELTALEKTLLRLLLKHGIRVLSEDTLTSEIDMNFLDVSNGKTTIARALFTDDEIIEDFSATNFRRK